MEIPQIIDLEVSAFLENLFSDAKIDMHLELSVSTFASLKSILTSHLTLLESLCTGMQIKIKGELWKGLLKTSAEMFKDSNMYGLGVVYLYSTTIACALQLNGNLKVKLEQEGIKQMKCRKEVQSLCFYPADLCPSD